MKYRQSEVVNFRKVGFGDAEVDARFRGNDGWGGVLGLDVYEVGDFGCGILGGEAGADDLAALHDVVVIGEGPGKIQILFDDDDGDAEFLSDAAQSLFDLFDDGGLDALGGFVEEE